MAARSAWRVLVVDDEENLNWSLVNSLQKEGYVTEGAHTGEEALQRMADAPFDCVISDVKMPGMDGFELLQWLRQHRPQTRVIMMTAFGSPTARQEALRNGVIAYLEKPFDLRTLKEKLRGLASADTAARAEEEGYDLLEVTRVLNLSRRDIAVTVQGGGFSGVLRFLRGELVYAEAGPLRGEQAFFAVCVPVGGQVQPTPWDGRTERNVTTPVSRLIYLALAERDKQSATSSPHAVAEPSAQPAEERAAALATPASPAAAVPPAEEPAAASSPQPEPSQGVPPAPAPVAQALDTVAQAIPSPCGVILLRLDGSLIGQAWKQLPALSSGAYSHLAAAAQAASRALLLGDIGQMQEMIVRAGERVLIVQRVAAADRAALVVAIVPGGAEAPDATATLQSNIAVIAEALR